IVMMLADMAYDGASLVLWRHYAGMTCTADDAALCTRIHNLTAVFAGVPPEQGAATWSIFPNPAGSLAAMILDGAGPENLSIVATIGFWTHASLVLIFANILPHSKHFHI